MLIFFCNGRLMNCTIVRGCSGLEADAAATYVRGRKNHFISDLPPFGPLSVCSEVLPDLDNGPQTRFRIVIFTIHNLGDLAHQVFQRLIVVQIRTGLARCIAIIIVSAHSLAYAWQHPSLTHQCQSRTARKYFVVVPV